VISFRRYAILFRVPEVARTLRASMVGRIPIGMAMLAILLFVQGATGSFARAGAASALYVFGLAVLAPFVGRVIDRVGPRPVLLANAVIYPAALLLLVVLVTRQADPLWVAVCALVAGAMLPPITICVRTLLPRLVSAPGLLQTAYSVDSALIEAVFILGPAFVAAFAVFQQPAGAVIMAAACAAVGTLIFVRAPAVRSWTPAQRPVPRHILGPLTEPKLLALLAATVLYSVSFGLFEVAVPAFAARHGKPAAAGVILALASVGSAFGVLAYGSREWRLALRMQFLLALVLMAAGMLLLAAVSNMYLFALLSLFACMPMAPVIAAQSMLLSRLAPPAMLAESFTWSTTCLLGGISAGIAAGGILSEIWSPALVLGAACVSAAAAGALAWATLPREG
jgi:MFS family permease